MNLWSIVAIIVFFAGVVMSQKLAANASARLDDVTKLKIVEIFPKRNVNYSILVFSMIIAMLLGTYFFPNYRGTILLLYTAAFIAYFVFKLIFNIQTLRKISAPSEYISSIQMSFIVFIGAILIGIGIIAVDNLR